MTRLTFLFALCATPGLAHSGAHLHPHGLDSAMLIAIAALGAAAAYTVVKVRK